VLYQLHPLPQLGLHHPPGAQHPRRSLQHWEILRQEEAAVVIRPMATKATTMTMTSSQVVKSLD
jgi:hypothetical protein